jgi:hypothetical protein
MKSIKFTRAPSLTSRVRRATQTFAPAVILLAAPAVWAQHASEPINDFGTLGQLNSGIQYANPQNVAPVACAPTSTVNALEFLSTYYGVSAGFANPNALTTYPAIDTMAQNMGTSYSTATTPPSGGTSFNGMVNGVTSYVSATGANPDSRVSVSSALWAGNNGNNTTTVNADASTLAHLLSADDGIEMLIFWRGLNRFGRPVTTGAHAVTLDAINYNPTTGVGTVGFVDPWGNGSAGPIATASYVTANVINLGGYLYMTNYSANNVAVPPFNDGGLDRTGFAGNQAVAGRIVGFVAESVPDAESTWILLGTCAAGLAALRRSLRH